MTDAIQHSALNQLFDGASELPQIKRHRRGKLREGGKGSLTHGKKTPENRWE
jgi:hypothetical protein